MQLRVAAVLSSCVLFAGLSSCYYMQAVRGHYDLISRGEPISELVDDPELDEDLKRKLEAAVEIRDYASQSLHLPDNDSYRIYADVERPYAVWNVFAAPEFSVDPKQWCFPVVGCVAYRGYFDQTDAQRFAEDLTAQAYDVYVGPVPAYSTLGRFDDPLLNTMMDWDEVRLAAVIFHELAHQRIYFKGDSMASESFAEVVEEEGVRRWLADMDNIKRIEEFELARLRGTAFAALVGQSRERLREIYSTDLDTTQMRAAKVQTFEELRESYGELKASWNGFGGYDAWFDRDLNNAHLVSIATYHELVPGWRALLESVDGNLDAFYMEADALSESSVEARHERLRSLGGQTATL